MPTSTFHQPRASVIYLHIQEVDHTHLVPVYSKDQKDDLPAGDKKLFRPFLQILKDQSRRAKGE